MRPFTAVAWIVVSTPLLAQTPRSHDIAELLGTWRGTSTCVDRTAAPACNDEVVVYEVRKGDKPGSAILAADKVVKDARVSMGDLTFAYDEAERCWRSDFESPRTKVRWCLTVTGDRLQGTARRLPGNEVVRRVEAARERRRPGY